MAINQNGTIRSTDIKRDGSIVSFRMGLDDGRNFPAGTVVVEDDGVLRQATDREAAHYSQANATEAQKAADRIANSGISTVLGLLNYLKAKFPEDFD